MSRQRVAFVTGASGFIGSHLVSRLVREGWQVHAVIRSGSHVPNVPEFERVVIHVHDGSTEGMVACLSREKPDVVFHLASLFIAQHITKDIESLIQSNVTFGNQLLEAMRINELKCLINTGTSWQHYNNENYNPVCLYAATKQAFESILEYYVQACGVKAITLKLFDTYGPGDPRPKLLQLLGKAMNSNESIFMSPGEQLIDLVHIDDVLDVFLLSAERLLRGGGAAHEIYAVSSGKPISLKELVKEFQDATDSKIPIEWGGRPYRYREVMVPWTNFRLLPGWSARRSLEESLQEMYRDKS